MEDGGWTLVVQLGIGAVILGGRNGEKDLRESKSKRMSKSNRTSKDVEAESNIGEGIWIADVGGEVQRE